MHIYNEYIYLIVRVTINKIQQRVQLLFLVIIII